MTRFLSSCSMAHQHDQEGRKRIDKLLVDSALLNQPAILAKFLEEQLEYVDQVAEMLDSDALLIDLGLDTMGKRAEFRQIISGATRSKEEKQKARSSEEIKSLIKRVKLERNLATSSKSKASNNKQRTVHHSWCHYDRKKDRFIPVRSNKGGGCRTVKLCVEADVDTVMQTCSEMFFPEGHSVEYGRWNDMERSIHNFAGERIEEESFSVGAYIRNNGLKTVRLYLYTKAKKWYDCILERECKEDDSGWSVAAREGGKGDMTSTRGPEEDPDFEDDLPVMIPPSHPYDAGDNQTLADLMQMQEIEIPCDHHPLASNYVKESSPLNLEKSQSATPATRTASHLSLEAPSFKQTPAEKEKKEEQQDLLELLDTLEMKRARRKQLPQLLLPDEPNLTIVETLEISVRTSLGSHIRRFRKASLVQELYDFVLTLEGVPDDFTLISLFPRTELRDTTTQVGEVFQTNKEAVYIEIKANGNVSILDKFLAQYTDDEVSLFQPHVGADDRRKTLSDGTKVNKDHMEDLERRRLHCLNSLCDWRNFLVRRNNIVNDFIQAYEKEGMGYSRLTTEFADEEGMDMEGITREAYTLFWEECLCRYFEGTGLYVPRVDPDCTPRLFHTLGKIASHGFVLVKVFPIYIVPSCLANAMFEEVPDNMLLDDFLSHIPDAERTAFQSVLQGRGDINQAILSCLSLYNLRKVPSGHQLKDTILDIARCEFLVKPQAIMREFKKGMFDCHPWLWSTVSFDELVTLYQNLNVDPDKVSELVVPSELDQPLNQMKDRVFNFLVRFLKSCTKEMAIAFMRYCTGSSVVVVPRIEVSFVDVSGFARRPVAHTCAARLDLSTSYESYAAFSREFSKILTNEEAFVFNAS